MHFRNQWLIFMLLLSVSVGCSHGSKDNSNAPKGRAHQEHNIMSTLWARYSAEYTALGFQAYHAAQMALDAALKKKVKNPAVITDLDETALDNIQYQIRNIAQDHSYTTESWVQWVNEAKAGAIAGAVDFFNYAAKKGVTIYYLSNRKVTEEEATMKNLEALGFPVKKESMLLKDKDKGKEARREIVRKKHGYVLYIGDNLMDFSPEYDNLNNQERRDAVAKDKEHYGVDYIILPNPMYGSWEDTLYDNNMKLSDEERALKRIEWLKKN